MGTTSATGIGREAGLRRRAAGSSPSPGATTGRATPATPTSPTSTSPPCPPQPWAKRRPTRSGSTPTPPAGAGFGDKTPQDNFEFLRPDSQGEHARVDLLTVLTEQVGQDHAEGPAMEGSLGADTRR